MNPMYQTLCKHQWWIHSRKKMPRHENVKGNGGYWASFQVQGDGGLWGYGRDEEIETE